MATIIKDAYRMSRPNEWKLGRVVSVLN